MAAPLGRLYRTVFLLVIIIFSCSYFVYFFREHRNVRAFKTLGDHFLIFICLCNIYYSRIHNLMTMFIAVFLFYFTIGDVRNIAGKKLHLSIKSGFVVTVVSRKELFISWNVRNA